MILSSRRKPDQPAARQSLQRAADTGATAVPPRPWLYPAIWQDRAVLALAGLASLLRVRLREAVKGRFGLLLPPDMAELKEEQCQGLRTNTFVFSAMGLNTILMVMLDFRGQIGRYGLLLSAGITLIYLVWVGLAAGCRGTRAFMRLSVGLLSLQGVLWGLIINELARVVEPSQNKFVTGIIMALVSTAMLGSPISVAIAFWLPTAVASILAVVFELRPADDYMAMSFAGYLAFTLAGVVVINRTLLERLVIRATLRRQNGTVQLLLRDYEENAADWLWETDSELRLRRVTPRFAQVLARSAEAAEGRGLHEVLDLVRSKDAGTVTVMSAMSARLPFRDVTVHVVIGIEQRWWAVTGRPVLDAAGRFAGYRGVGSDITEVKRADDMARFLATHDSLTGIGNRRMFLDALDVACGGASAAPDAPRRPFALLSMDLDRFKEVNDDHGHASGDAVLMAVAARIGLALRDGDTVARLGGDEFAMLLPGASEREAAMAAERVIAAVGERIGVGDVWLGVGASVGIAMFPRDGRTPMEIMRSVDLALYRAKTADRGTYRVFDPALGTEFHDRVALLAELRTAITEGGLQVQYQPIVDLATGRVASMEALSRWDHPVRGMVPPSTFIPLAEECGLISSLGRAVLKEACEAAIGWDSWTGVSVNLSPVQFKNPELPGVVADVLRTTGLDPRRLELEITESAWLGANQQTSNQLAKLEALGVGIVMDDFGTGYSSLSSLQTFRFDGLKIDAAFIRNVETDPRAAAIVRLVAALAAELGLPITAEGIETEGQLAIVRQFGIRRVQGFLLGRPQALTATGLRSRTGIASKPLRAVEPQQL